MIDPIQAAEFANQHKGRVFAIVAQGGEIEATDIASFLAAVMGLVQAEFKEDWILALPTVMYLMGKADALLA